MNEKETLRALERMFDPDAPAGGSRGTETRARALLLEALEKSGAGPKAVVPEAERIGRLAAYLDGELDAAERDAFEAELATDPAAYEEFLLARSMIDKAAAGEASRVPAAPLATLAASLRSLWSDGRAWRWAGGGLVTAALAFVVVTTQFSDRYGSPTMAPNSAPEMSIPEAASPARELDAAPPSPAPRPEGLMMQSAPDAGAAGSAPAPRAIQLLKSGRSESAADELDKAGANPCEPAQTEVAAEAKKEAQTTPQDTVAAAAVERERSGCPDRDAHSVPAAGSIPTQADSPSASEPAGARNPR